MVHVIYHILSFCKKQLEKALFITLNIQVFIYTFLCFNLHLFLMFSHNPSSLIFPFFLTLFSPPLSPPSPPLSPPSPPLSFFSFLLKKNLINGVWHAPPYPLPFSPPPSPPLPSIGPLPRRILSWEPARPYGPTLQDTSVFESDRENSFAIIG